MEKIKALPLKLKIIISVIIVAVLLIIGTIVFYFNGISAVSSKDKEVIVTIPENSTGNKILDILDDNGLINSSLAAKVHLKLNSYDFKSNTYILNENMSLETMLSIIEKADKDTISQATITLIDGQTIPEYAAQISEKTGITQEEILSKWEDPTYINSLIEKYWFLDESILNEDIYFPLEGYLAPDTYQISASNENIEDITTKILDQSKKVFEQYKDDINKFKVGDKQLTTHEFLTLASIVQRESPSNNKDRKEIAGVLINRLNKPMRLQSDVTVNYANQVTKVAVTYKDLKTDSKYNTYQNEGLPCGPISSISNDVIKDTLNYNSNEYYFFFATKDAKVLYSVTYEEHQQKVNENKWY